MIQYLDRQNRTRLDYILTTVKVQNENKDTYIATGIYLTTRSNNSVSNESYSVSNES